MGRPVRVHAVVPLTGFVVLVTFTDGTSREMDLERYLHGPIFEPIRSPESFRQITVDPVAGTIAWPNGADIDPDVLYHDLTPAWQQPDAGPSAVDSVA